MRIHDANPLEQEAARFLGTLHYPLAATERVEVRYKEPGEGQPMCRRFVADPAEAARYAVRLGHDQEVYAGAATRLGEDGTKAGVSRLWALWADLDVKGSHTREDRLKQLADLSHRPSILVWTGGGFHSYWRLREPAEGPEDLERGELVMRRLAGGLNGDPVHDRSRIMRVPGTHNFKYGEPRSVVMEQFDPDLRYGLEELQEMAEALPAETDDGRDQAGGVPREVLSSPIREGGRNVALASVAGSLRDRGLDAETICVVLLEVNRLRCEPPLAEAEVLGVGRSVGRYPAGAPRYRRSSARRIYTEKEAK
jgi:hypothetical protein